jgi:hypothetical protein
VLTAAPWWTHAQGVEPIVGSGAAASAMIAGTRANSAASALAHSSGTDPGTLMTLLGQALQSYSREPALLRSLAENPSLPVDGLIALTAHTDWIVREWAARHPNLAEPTRRLLARDVNARVRAAIGARSDCPEDVLRTLAEDSQPMVREAVAANRSEL